MIRNVLVVLFAIFLLIVQGNFFRLFPLLPQQLSWTTPTLTIPLVVYLGLNEPRAARGAILAFVIGSLADAIASGPAWVFTFSYVLSWWYARIVGNRFSGQSLPGQIGLGFVFTAMHGVLIIILLAIFGSDSAIAVELAPPLIPHSCVTALLSPLVFRIAQRIYPIGHGTTHTSGSSR